MVLVHDYGMVLVHDYGMVLVHDKVCMDIKGIIWTLYYILINNQQFSGILYYQFAKASPRSFSI